ncbi:energy transducer TonB [Massilia sp. Root351]|uniref:TonB-dependent receptor n=1 Tax=Massilia sp. Root351 TaxID=1736522 RepID=UPI0007091982|nr:TonB-dependent siderophore receptor [Massilia sp. Root351]KQV90718.1 energy transducer TonB [Massilia sp. Root351]
MRINLLCGLAATMAPATAAMAADPAPDSRILPQVTVTAEAEGLLPQAYAGGQLARGGRLGLLGNVDTMDTPFQLSSFTAQAIADQQAATVADMVRLDPSVRSTAPGGDVADAFFVRGFALGDNNIGEIAFDGLYGVAPNYRLMADYAERIEVLKGPAAMLYGMSPNSGVGGSINLVPKRAGADLSRVRADLSSRSQLGGHLDLSRRFGAQRQFGARFNATLQDGDTALDQQSRRARMGALALDYEDARLRVTLDAIDQREQVDAPTRRPFLSAGLAVPQAPGARRNLTQRWEWYDSTERSALLRAEYQAARALTLFASHGAASSDVQRLFNTPSIVNAAGDTSVAPARAGFDIERDAGEAGLRAAFATGAVRHRLTLQWSRYNDRYGTGSVAGQAYASNIHRPAERPAQAVSAPASLPLRSASRLDGAAVSDTLSLFGERLQLMLGLRKQDVRSDNFSPAGAVTARYDDSAVTPMVAVVIQPAHGLALYGNYVEGLSKGDIAPGTASNAGEVFAPYKARQREVGVKVDHGRLMTSLSVFQITRPSGFMSGNVFGVEGEQRNRGVELNAYGAVAGGLRLHGGLAWTDAKLVKTGNPATAGKTAVGVPDLQLSAQAEWDVPQLAGLTLTGGVLHNSAQYANQANSQRLPAWTTVDAGARYRTVVGGKQVVLRATLRNAGGKDYWSGASTWGTLTAGAPRSLLLSATTDF